MAKKMTWDEQRQMHLDLWRDHYNEAKKWLDLYIETHDYKCYIEHEKEYKLSNRHWGIAEAMWTRKYGKH